MGVFSLLRSELQKLIGNKALLFSLIGVLLIPIVYVAVLLSAKWGPYDNMDNLPVAVVNNDAGGVSDGNPINVGKDLEETLKNSPTLGWHFVSMDEANAGLEKNEFYMIIEIPEDFSQKVTTVLDKNPEVPEIRYIRNEGMNFMASQVTNSAVERIKEQLGDKITATFASTVFSKFPEIAEGFMAGADGSQQILDGTISLADGTGQILSSLTEKAPDIQRLAVGARQADSGAGQLLSAVSDGTSSVLHLADGAGQVAAGAEQLNAGSGDLASGAQQLSAGTSELATGAQQLSAGTSELATGAEELVGGTSQLADGSSRLEDGATQVLDGLVGLKGGQTQLLEGLLSLQGGSSQVYGGLQQVQGGAPQILTGLESAQSGTQQLVGGLASLQEGSQTLEGSLYQVAD